MPELRDTLPADRRLRFEAIVAIPLELDAEGCTEAISLADDLEQLSDPHLLEHLRALRKPEKEALRPLFSERRRTLARRTRTAHQEAPT